MTMRQAPKLTICDAGRYISTIANDHTIDLFHRIQPAAYLINLVIMATMHVPTFTSLTPVEQCEQLENYLKELNPSLSFTTVDRLMFSANLKEVVSALDVVLALTKEAEVESVLNSVVTLLFELQLNQDESRNLINTFSSHLAESSNDKLAAVCLRV